MAASPAALRRLLADIDAGRIDMVIIYKIDRLTRSRADFAKLVERFEAARCSFVPVTQSFKTSTSMGRLTLNVLLSFAQFEREVTAERIRDKLAASKKKGLWMGGLAPLGYDPHPDRSRRELVVNHAEAEVVRRLFDLYLEHGCLSAMAAAAKALGLRSKRRAFASSRLQGDAGLCRGHIHKILLDILAPFTCRCRGVEMKIIASERPPSPAAAMIRALRQAHRWADLLKTGTALKTIADCERLSESYVARILSLATLAPRLQEAILIGIQPPELSLATLVRNGLPLAWTDQEQRFGLGR